MAKQKKSGELVPFARLSTVQLWIVGIICVAGYFLYSFLSDGFYQHDEAAHFLSMRRFWDDPNSILGNWAKPGFKLIYILPALLGHNAVTLFNAAIAGLTVIFSYRIAEELEFKIPSLTIPLVALQPFWIQLAFRNYSEIISACLLTAAILLHLRKYYIPAALLLSYLTMIRQEFYVFVLLYGIYLLVRKQWIPFLLLGLGPIIYNVWGWLATGDYLYLINNVISTSERYSSAYPRQGFQHYFVMSIVIFGPIVVGGLVYTFTLWMRKHTKPLWIIGIPFGVYFLIHAVFNLQAIEIGAATGGNLRYMLVITPLAGILANQSLEQLNWLKNDNFVKIVMAVFVAVVALFMSYEHNNIIFTDQRNWIPLILVSVLVAVIWIVNKRKILLYTVASLALVSAFLQVKPMPISAEDAMVKKVAAWMEDTNALQRPILSNHTLLNYYLNRTRAEYPKGNTKITRKSVREAPVGTIIVWDSHYSYRPNLREGTLSYKYFTERENYFKPIRNFMTSNRRFGVLIFEKIAKLPENETTAGSTTN